MTPIIPGSLYGDVRQQASSDPMPHGLTASTIDALGDRMEKFLPGLSSEYGQASKQFFNGLLPDGAEMSPTAGRMRHQANLPSGVSGNNLGGNFGNNTFISNQRPYQPEFECLNACSVVQMSNGEGKYIKDIQVGDRVIDKTGRIQTVEKHWCSGTPDKVVKIKLWGGKTIKATVNHNFPVWAWLHNCACGCGEEVNKPGRCYLPHHANKHNIDGTGVNLVYIDGEIEKEKIINGKKRTVKGKHARYIPEGYEPIQKLSAGELKAGDFLMMPRKFDPIKTSVTLDEARLLGYYLAEGCEYTGGSENYRIGSLWYYGIHERDTWAKDTLEILSKLDIETKYDENEERNTCRVATKGKNAKLLAEWLVNNAGRYSYAKQLSEEVMRWPLKLKIELIRGAFRGDGSQFINKQKGKYNSRSFRVSYVTTSETLTRQLQLILSQIGIFGAIGSHGRKKKEHHHQSYVITIGNSHALRLANLVWEDTSIAKSFIKNNTVRERFRVDDDYIYVPIKSVKIIGNKKPVYNMTVSGDHSYLVENLGSYNSPDRQQFPVHRILANRYWRLFYKLDPVIGNCIDMFGSMPWSDFQLTGEGITGEIKETLETQCENVNLLRTLEYMVREFMVIGEAVPHLFFDEAAGIWSYCALHNPDQLEVIDAPFIKMDPVVEFIPDDRLRAVLTSNNHLLRQIRDQMPPELVSRLIARQNIPLSPINMTFIPRRLHPYDTRGTSIISRMWRILMYEDAIYNASINTARRHAGPIKVAKLGNPQTGWIPSQEHEQKLLQLLAQAETDTNAWLVYHYGIQFELVGTTDRVMNINQHHDVIERIKLIAIGISKAFLHGEVTYASSVTGLSVFLQRMKAMRNFFEHSWILPKFFKTIARINGWVKRDQRELNHRYRIKRSQREIELENRWIVPNIEWEKQLDHNINTELIGAMTSLEGLGVRFSKTSKYAAAGKKFEDELAKIKEEQEYETQMADYLPPEQMPGPGPGTGGAPPVGGAKPPASVPPTAPVPGTMPPPDAAGTPGVPGAPTGGPMGRPTPPTGPRPTAPGGGGMASSDKDAEGGGSGPSGKRDPAVRDTESTLWDHKGRSGNWSVSEIQELANLIREGHTDSPLWGELDGPALRRAVDSGDPFELMEVVEEFLEDHGYPASDSRHLRRLLDSEGVFKDIATGELERLTQIEEDLPDDTASINDEAMTNKLSGMLDGERGEVVKMDNPDSFLVGHGNEGWSGDVSNLVK